MKKQRRIAQLLIFVLVPILLASCIVTQMGVLQNSDIYSDAPSSIHFDSPYGLIIIPVKIKGKTYRFLFDTGFQTSSISKELAIKYRLKKSGKIKVLDSQNTQQKLPISKLDTLVIGNMTYGDVGLFIADFKSNPLFSCFQFDGVIGMNIIRLNNWKIDYDTQTIYIQSKGKANTSRDAVELPFTLKRGMPMVDLYLNQASEKFLVDLGYNGQTPSVASKEVIHPVLRKTVGYSSFGLFNQTQIDTTFYTRLSLSDSLDFHLDSVVVNFSNHKLALIGNGFFKKYYSTIQFDFEHNKIYLEQKKGVDKNVYTYPFAPQLFRNSIAVGLLNTSYHTIEIGDSVVSINGLSAKNHSICELLLSYWESKSQLKPLDITIKTKEGEIIKLTLPIQPIKNEKLSH